ncbi:hypothetical protein ACGFNP_47440 [Nonomuraea sp. NPDC049269]|uniref:hypothetical protein n=1 Tax=Nonomuraea sp. NPDC049269 TaxID=3364349 RepID=UPI00371DBA55
MLHAAPDRPVITVDVGDLAYITLTLVDSAETVHTAADRPVRVDVSGDGTLIGFGSADPANKKGFDSIEHHTYQGRALAVVKPTAPGTIRLTATAPDCNQAEVLVTVEKPAR